MFTKYKIKLEKDGLTIMQWVNPGAARTAPDFSSDNALQGTIDQSKHANAAKVVSSASSRPGQGGDGADFSAIPTPGTGGGDGGDFSAIPTPGTGGGDFGGTGAPITIIGPNIFMGSPCHHSEKEKKG